MNVNENESVNASESLRRRRRRRKEVGRECSSCPFHLAHSAFVCTAHVKISL